MSKYRFVKGWKRWDAGDVIDEYEYNRLPIEIKNAIMEKVEDQPSVVVEIPKPVEEPSRPEEIKRVVKNYFKPQDVSDSV